jgi:flagellin
MVTSVNNSSLTALLAQQSAQANRAQTGASGGSQAANADAATDPAVIYAGTEGGPSASAILSLQNSLNSAASIADVSVGAGQTISDLISEIRGKVTAAQATDDPAQRASLDAEYQSLLQTIDKVAGSASFQGVNMVDGSSDTALQFSAGLSGDASVSLTPQNLTTGGPLLSLANTGLTGSDDLSAETAKLQALSVQQMLSGEAYGVANQAPSALLSLFR